MLIFSIAEPYQVAGVFGGDGLMHVTHFNFVCCSYALNAGQCVAQARPISSIEKMGLGQSSEWLLLDGYYQLTIRKNAEDHQWHLRPELTLQSKQSSFVNLLTLSPHSLHDEQSIDLSFNSIGLFVRC